MGSIAIVCYVRVLSASIVIRDGDGGSQPAPREETGAGGYLFKI